ncbi:MAG: hypothetical protein FJ104_10105, partial [Deltaproteobacteria bacterium]|nr:hypothetical protein [Deltaproteobacteria bacterium]
MAPVRRLILASLFCSAPAFAHWGQPAPQYGQGGSQGGYGPGMQAGGLAPPSAPAEDPEAAQTEAELAAAEEEDSGRGLEWFWLNGEIGAEHLRLDTFSATGRIVPGIEQTNQSGLAVGAGLGLRLVFVTLGPRFRLASFSDFQLWTLGGELGLRIPLGSVEPYFTAGGGYASLGAFDARSLAGVDAGQVDVTGYYARVGG